MTGSRTHGPWHGLDFIPTTDINRTRELCPNGWVFLEWDGSRMRLGYGFGFLVAAWSRIEWVLRQNPPEPGDYPGHGTWQPGRAFIWRADECQVTGALLCDGNGAPVFADELSDEGRVMCGHNVVDLVVGHPPPGRLLGRSDAELVGEDAWDSLRAWERAGAVQTLLWPERVPCPGRPSLHKRVVELREEGGQRRIFVRPRDGRDHMIAEINGLLGRVDSDCRSSLYSLIDQLADLRPSDGQCGEE